MVLPRRRWHCPERDDRKVSFVMHSIVPESNHQGVQTSHGYNPQDDQKFFDLLSSDPVQLDIAIRAAEGVVEHLKDLRSAGTGPEEDPPTKLSALMIGALHASDNKWIEENSRRCYLNAYLDD